MAKYLAVKKFKALHPIDAEGEAVLRNIGQGEIISIEIKRPRNVLFHRKLFALLSIILENQEFYASIEDLLDVAKIRAGHVRVIETKLGQVLVPKSISFASMDDIQFQAFYDKVMVWVCTEVIPGLSRHDLDEEVRQQLLEFGSSEPEPVIGEESW